MKIKITELNTLILKTLRKKYDEEDSKLIRDVILFGELSGKTSHGIVRLIVGGFSVIAQNPTKKPDVIPKTKVSALIQGNMNPGTLVGPMAMKEVISLAKANGFGIVGTRNSTTSSGCISYYLEQIANQNLIAIVMAQSPVSTVAYGGIEPLFGTNPISFGIPAYPKPILFDMATAAISFGAMLQAKTLGKQLPPNVALDKDGNMTTDPNLGVEGSTYAFDNSYKGSGLAMMVEILSGLWPGANFVGKNPNGGWGNTFMAFSPDLLIDIEEFKNKAKLLIDTVRNSKTKTGDKIRISGETTIENRDNAITNGVIVVEDELYKQLVLAAS